MSEFVAVCMRLSQLAWPVSSLLKMLTFLPYVQVMCKYMHELVLEVYTEHLRFARLDAIVDDP